MKQELQRINFYGNEIFTVEKDGEHYVAMKPICEAIGLQWHAQRKRILRHPVLSEGASMMDSVAEDEKNREMLMLPLKMLNGWLFGIDANRVKPEIRDRLLQYQRECFDVLNQYWQKKSRSDNPAVSGDKENDSDKTVALEVFMEIALRRLQSGHGRHRHTATSIHTAMVLKHVSGMESESLQLEIDVVEQAQKIKISPRQFRDALTRLHHWGLVLVKPKSRHDFWVVILTDKLQTEINFVRLKPYRAVGNSQSFSDEQKRSLRNILNLG